MTLCGRLIGGAVNLLADTGDMLASFWQTPREVEWAKAAADLPLSHWKVGDSYCGLCGENITAVSFHACPMRTEAEPEATSKRYTIEDVFDLRNEQYVPCMHCGQRRRAHEEPYTGACQAFVAHETPAVTPHTAASGPAEGSPDKPSAVVDECTCPWVDPELWTVHYGAVEPGSQREFDPSCPEHGLAPSAEVEPPASVPSAESPAPEFDWVTAAIPVIAGALAEHTPVPGRSLVACFHSNVIDGVCGEFADWQDWRDHVSSIIAARLQTPRSATVYNPSGDRPRPPADFPKHQK